MAAQERARRIESDNYIVRIIESTPPGQGTLGDHILLVIDKREKLAFRLEALGSGRFESMHLYEDRLAFFGWFGTNAQGGMIFDLRKREFIDSFLCWYKTVSPSGRWLAYTWRYSRWAHELYSDILLVYDLARSPSGNRVIGSSERPGGENVGIPVYPPENATPRNYNPWVGEKPEAKHDLRLYDSGFHAWVERDGKLLLIDQTPASVKFVEVAFGDDAQEATIRQGDIPKVVDEALQSPNISLGLQAGRGHVAFRRCADCALETLDVLLAPAP